MGVFSRELPELRPLVDPPKGGESIVLDEEEQRYAKKRPRPMDGLRDLAQSRIKSGDLKGAAVTLVKVLDVEGDAAPELTYLLLAEIFSRLGDDRRARLFRR